MPENETPGATMNGSQDTANGASKTAETPKGSPDSLEEQIRGALRTVYDPEIPVSIYELGLIYDLKVDAAGQVGIKMTLTAPSCPEAEALPGRVENAVKGVHGVTGVALELIWEPPWNMSKMSEAAKLQLGLV